MNTGVGSLNRTSVFLPESRTTGTMPCDEVAFQRIREWLNNRCGIHIPDKKRELFLQRLNKVCNRFQFGRLSELLECLEHGFSRDVQIDLMHAVSTNHSYFFREPAVLTFFEDSILPGLKQRHKKIRIWSAACSSGDEAHTLAIIAVRKYGLEWTQSAMSILGTDLSEPIIALAESGTYRSNHLEHTPLDILNRYFRKMESGSYLLAEEIRRLCVFRRLNLKARPFPFKKRFHCVFCRNVLYYFDKQNQLDTVESLYDATEPGGWLLTSVTESLHDLDTHWRHIGGGIYRKPE